MMADSPPPLIPRDVLFGNPTRDAPQISPDGTMMAYLAPVDGVLNVWVGTIGRDDDRPVTADRDRGIRGYLWSFDNRKILYVQDRDGDENWRLYATELETRVTRCLTDYENVQVQIVDYQKHHPRDMLIAMNLENPAAHDAYHLDIDSGALTLVAKNPGNVVGWVSDTQLQIRGAQVSLEGGSFALWVRDTVEADWRTLVEWSSADSHNSSPIGFSHDGRSMQLVDSRDWNAGRLVTMDIATGAVEVIAQDPVYDAGPIMVHPDTHEIQMVAFTRARREWQVLDPTIGDDIEAIRQVNPGDFGVYDRTVDDDVWLVGFTQDAGPVAYYAFDRRTKEARFLFHNRPELADATLAPMSPISFTSRDGLAIHGYLTVPAWWRPGEPGPTVLNVHGGPWHRDTWGYHAEAQWLANRGYACLQVNFRGSTGYGKEFLNAGNREWGGRMHDDLVDAVRWAVDSNIADPDRVAIYGGSYGGYAALVGATRTPDLFRCAVDIVGVSNLITFIESIPPYWSAYLEDLYRRVGHPERDASFLRERSPLTHVENITIPILIAQGANDPRVKQAESEQIIAAMKDKGIPYEYLLFPDEGHGFARPENNLRFYAAAEAFLATNLGGRSEP